jgi:hypothetical protein
MSQTHDMRVVDYVIGIPMLLLLAILMAICLPPYIACRALIRSLCPECKIPLSCRVLSETFVRPNIKCNLDHYIVKYECRWCGHHWNREVLKNATICNRSSEETWVNR